MWGSVLINEIIVRAVKYWWEWMRGLLNTASLESRVIAPQSASERRSGQGRCMWGSSLPCPRGGDVDVKWDSLCWRTRWIWFAWVCPTLRPPPQSCSLGLRRDGGVREQNFGLWEAQPCRSKSALIQRLCVATTFISWVQSRCHERVKTNKTGRERERNWRKKKRGEGGRESGRLREGEMD